MGNNGEPVRECNLLKEKQTSVQTESGIAPAWRDDFDSNTFSLSWQWSGNYRPQYAFCNASQSLLRLFSYPADSISVAPNLFLQKIPAERTFTATAKVRFTPNKQTAQYARAGLIVAGRKCFMLDAPADSNWVWLRVEMTAKQEGRFYLSRDGKTYMPVGMPFQAVEGEWIGAKIGLYCSRRPVKINDSGYLDVDYFEIR